jgi:hypothetical protein
MFPLLDRLFHAHAHGPDAAESRMKAEKAARKAEAAALAHPAACQCVDCWADEQW